MGTAFCLEQLSPLTAFSTNTEIPKRQWWVYTKCCRKHKQQSDNTIYVRGNMIKLNLNQKWPDVKTKHKNNAKWDNCLRNKLICGLLMNYLNTVSEKCIIIAVYTWIHTEPCFLFSFAFIWFDLGGGVSRQNHWKHFIKPTALQLRRSSFASSPLRHNYVTTGKHWCQTQLFFLLATRWFHWKYMHVLCLSST